MKTAACVQEVTSPHGGPQGIGADSVGGVQIKFFLNMLKLVDATPGLLKLFLKVCRNSTSSLRRAGRLRLEGGPRPQSSKGPQQRLNGSHCTILW